MEAPQKTKCTATVWASNSTSGHIARQDSNPKGSINPGVHSSIIHNSQDTETTSMPIDRGTDKEDVVQTHSEILLGHQKQNATCSNTDGLRGHPTVTWRTSERERQIPHETTCLQSLKQDKWTYLWNSNRLTDREQTCQCQGGWGGGGMDWEVEISRRKLLYTGWINNKVLLCSTGNYILYPVIEHNRKEYEK